MAYSTRDCTGMSKRQTGTCRLLLLQAPDLSVTSGFPRQRSLTLHWTTFFWSAATMHSQSTHGFHARITSLFHLKYLYTLGKERH